MARDWDAYVAHPFADPLEERIADAMVGVIFEQGYCNAELQEVFARAGVGEEEFNRCFFDKEDCVLKIYEAYIADFQEKVQEAYDEYSTWRDSLRAAAYASVAWMMAQPRTARFGAVDVLEAKNELIRVRREEVFRYCAGLIDAGRAVAPEPAAVPANAAILAIGSIAQTLTEHFQRDGKVLPVHYIPELMYLAIRPYVGEEIAREELEIPPPPGLVGEAD